MTHFNPPLFSLSSVKSFALYSIVLLAANPLFTPDSLFAENGKHMGVASCASSNCHGATSPRRGDILQNEFTTWFKHGRHSKGWTVLLQEDAQKIGDHLGINKPEEDARCLTCHATDVPEKDLRGDKYTVEDGVGCETCHGAASGWIQSHTKNGATHSDNVKRGMKDLTVLSERTRLCLSCYIGDDEKIMNHELIGAGHPRLSFELDTFSMIQPRHWNVDEDYKTRKGGYISAKAWLMGQVILASERMAALASETRSKNGEMPELSIFTCYSCHHSLTEDQWKARRYGGRPGQLLLNLSSLRTAIRALKAIRPSVSKELHTLMEPLPELYREGNGRSQVLRIKGVLDTKATQIVEELEYSDANLMKLLREMSAFATEPYFQYEEAEQILMGISSVLATSKNLNERYKGGLDELYKALDNPEAFKAEKFTAAAQKFQNSLR